MAWHCTVVIEPGRERCPWTLADASRELAAAQKDAGKKKINQSFAKLINIVTPHGRNDILFIFFFR
jgi:hypothetical protein